MNSYSISELEDGTTFSNHLFLDEKFQLLDTEVPFTASMKQALTEWQFRVVFSDGNAHIPDNPAEPAAPTETKKDIPQNVNYESVDLDNLLGLPQNAQSQPPEPPTEVPDLPTPASEKPAPVKLEKNISIDDLDDLFGELDAPLGLDDTEEEEALPEEPPAADDAGTDDEPPAFDAAADAERIAQARAFYNDFLDYIDTLFKNYTAEQKLDAPSVAEKVNELRAFVKENRPYILRIMPTDEAANKHFLVNHSMRSTVLALIIGMTLRMTDDKLTELGVACMLHEIGQIRLPPQVYMTDQPLSDEERGKMAAHPILSYYILKENNFPHSVQIAVLEHHEHEDGTGYPRKLSGNNITSFAKIIAVACSFEAITAPRQFRQARTTHEAMLDMLKDNEQQYDDIVLKALLHSLSLYPIGAFVQLASGKTAQVVNSNPGNPAHPVIRLTDGTHECEADDGDYKIVRVLDAQEASALKTEAE